MKTYFKNMSMFFMGLAAIASLVIGLNITNVKNFSASVINSVFPLECRVEYRESGSVIENALVTFDGDIAIVKSGSDSHKISIDDIVLTDDTHTQRVENTTRAFLLFAAIMLIAASLPLSLICVSLNYRAAALACSHAKARSDYRVIRGRTTEARPASIAA